MSRYAEIKHGLLLAGYQPYRNLISQTGILPSCSRVNNIVWLHYRDSNETPREKAKWELHKNAASCLE